MAVLALASCAAAGNEKGTHAMVSLEVKPDHDEYIAGEEITIQVAIDNMGPDAVEIPDPEHYASTQPTYGIIGPSFPSGKLFSNRSLAEEQGTGAADIPEVAAVRIEAGGAWRGGFQLGPLLGQLLPGEYRLRSVLNWQAARAQSQDKRFRIKPAEIRSVAVGIGTRPLDSAEGNVVIFNGNAASTTLLAFGFNETRPDIGEITANAPIAQATIGANARDAATPWKNEPYYKDLVQWTVWREGREIKSISDAGGKPDSLTLPVDPVQIVHPPFKLHRRPIEVLVTGADKQLYLCTFPDFSERGRPGLSIAWHVPLPAAPAGITAALAPEGRNDAKHVAMAAKLEQGFEIWHAGYQGTGLPSPFRAVRVPQMRLVEAVPPAMMVGVDGTAHVTVMAIESDGSYAAVEVRFSGSGGPSGEPAVERLGSLPATVTGGTFLYVDKAGRLLRRDVAVNVAGHGVMRWRQSDGWKAKGMTLPDKMPVILVPGAAYSYVLGVNSGNGFFFEPL
jgi:hypothetical protein